jgi:hypothetical protein
MKPYIITTGLAFGLILLAHAARVWAEGWHLLREPVFGLTSLASAALCVWAWRIVRAPRS